MLKARFMPDGTVKAGVNAAKLPVPCKTGMATMRWVVTMAAAPTTSSDNSSDGKRLSKRQQQMLQMGLEDGWGVLAVDAPTDRSQQPGASSSGSRDASGDDGWGVDVKLTRSATPATQAKKPKAARKAEAMAAQGTASPSRKSQGKQAGTGAKAAGKSPFMDIKSEQGMLGMLLLQRKLRGEGGAPLTPEELAEIKSQAAALSAQKEGGAGGPAGAGARARRRVVYVDDDDNVIGEEDEGEDITDTPTPAFSLTIGEDSTEFAEYDRAGNVTRRTA
eukprot:CAMPEP_0202878620 /NCGR_PEP_ID=MMETSP1391-20130828/32475_1 /ASSEMBLY_ACC=CAM_ASM_000867 /TAXON_ID=1034604 /ORGANISM="Chlamydomonas leiostraca, Strain SAG 11-49" /LENGTH=275 /DNA_ID=CAMNT_0049560839 /DNA_START=69 /DNA_END=893 /DNA_ORIENTATION=-